MESLQLLKEIEAWLCFNTEPSKEETAKLRKSINDHVTEQLNLHNVIKSVCDDCTAYPFDERGKTPLCNTCKDNPKQNVV